MRLKRLLILLLVALCSCLTAVADTFIVTSNADAGPGTFREAIINSAANGTLLTDSIFFNFFDTSRNGRTIIPLSDFPFLTSNLYIDGTTQTGSAIGLSDARVTIHINTPQPVSRWMLNCTDANNVQILGLFLLNSVFTEFSNWGIISGIIIRNSKNIVIGKPGKGNYFRGLSTAILTDNNLPIANFSENITIQSNIFNNDEKGGTSLTNIYGAPNSILNPMHYALNFRNVHNITIGGNSAEEGNSILARWVLIQSDHQTGNGPILIAHNYMGIPATGIIDSAAVYGIIEFSITGDYSMPADYTVTVLDNTIHGPLKLFGLSGFFTIKRNTLFDQTNNYPNLYTRISVSGCTGGGIIGGEDIADRNTLYADEFHTGNYEYSSIGQTGIRLGASPGVTIWKNTMYCNAYYHSGIEIASFLVPPITILVSNPGFVSGKAPPGSRVDVYIDDECSACEGKVYLGKTTAAADSNWSFSGNFNGTIIATATKSDGSTTAFTGPILYTNNISIKHPSCGLNTGSIKGFTVTGTWDTVEWYKYFRDSLGYYHDSLYSTGLDLTNASPGTYYIIAKWKGTCKSTKTTFTLQDLTPLFDTSQVIFQHPGCGQFNGRISWLRVTNNNNTEITCKNESGLGFPVIYGSGYYWAHNLPPGKYRFFARDTIGGCMDSTRIYNLINQSGPSLDINNIQITPASCYNKNGQITGIISNNITGTPFIGWYDSTGNLVGSALDLNLQSAGRYRLKFKDASPCDTIITPYFTINNNGAIVLDSSQLKIKPSGCQLNNGSIRGIRITGATSYEWINTLTSSIVSTAVDLVNAGPGTYRLIARNNLYGCAVQSKDYTIVNATPLLFQLARVTMQEARCNLDNGFILIEPVNVNSTNFSFHWLKDSSSTVGTGLSLQNIGPGRYQCIATDTNGCQQQVFAHTVVMMPLPTIDESRLQIKADTCNLSVGSVSGISINSDNPSLTYAWYNALNQKISSSQSVQKIPAGTYYLIATDIRQCAVRSNEFTVGNITRPPQNPLYKDVMVPKGVSISIEPITKLTGSYSFFANAVGGSPIQTNNTGKFTLPPILNDTAFYIELTQGDCSSARTRVNVKVVNETKIVVPNAFTPNNDGKNDTWGIRIYGIVKLNYIRVFNRWGQLIYETSNPDARWTGAMNGKLIPSGTYAWSLSGTDYFNKPIQQTGTVTIIR